MILIFIFRFSYFKIYFNILSQYFPDKMFKTFILFVIVEACLAAPQFIINSSPAEYQHPAVLINSQMEDTLPNELRNDFYKNPLIAAGLANESLLTPKEMKVLDKII